DDGVLRLLVPDHEGDGVRGGVVEGSNLHGGFPLWSVGEELGDALILVVRAGTPVRAASDSGERRVARSTRQDSAAHVPRGVSRLSARARGERETSRDMPAPELRRPPVDASRGATSSPPEICEKRAKSHWHGPCSSRR